MKNALITGVTGQDGAYLTKLLLEKGYRVYGVVRRSSTDNMGRLEYIFNDPEIPKENFSTLYGDLNDSSSLISIIKKTKPDEIYNLGAQSHVKVSFEVPEYTASSDGLGTLRILEALRILNLKDTRFYQASTSELYGKVLEETQTEGTPFYPRSPYGAAKLYAYWITVNYREAYDIFASNGILFNHESPLRGKLFVTKKITRAVAQICYGLQETLFLGNLDAQRDWGHARDYVEAMWKILQHHKADDWVVATGVTVKIRDFLLMAFDHIGVEIEFKGKGYDEEGIIKKVWNKELSLKKGSRIVAIDPELYRPSEVQRLCGDARKARENLGWKPKVSLKNLVAEMVDFDLKQAEARLTQNNGWIMPEMAV